MTKPSIACAAGLLLALSLPQAAQAHKSWLLPHASLLEGRSNVVVVDAAVSEDLFEFERALELGQVQATGPDGRPVAVEPVVKARHRSSFEVALNQPGTYRISNHQETMLVSYRQGNETKRWRGKPEDRAAQLPADAQIIGVSLMHGRQETFVSKDGAGAAVPAPPSTAGLNLLALDPVTDLSSGDTTRFVLLSDGRPAAGVNVTLVRAGNRYRYALGEETFKTNERGEFSVVWREGGRHWLGASHGDARPAPVAAGAAGPDSARNAGTVDKPLRRAGYSATFDVLPK
jgi:hypothetical protein